MESGIYIVSTPIGNMEDMTPRAQRVLAGVDVIAAEDTRHTRRLLDHFGITTPMISLHEHNERQKAATLIARAKQGGESIALVSDAGTPLISDPGYILVAQAREADVPVTPVPGVCALVAALSVSGLASHRFAFEGFLPAKTKAREDAFRALERESRTVIFYESTHRIVASMTQLAELYPQRRVCLAREITKRYETVFTGEASAVLAWLCADAVQQKGEFVLIVEGIEEAPNTDDDVLGGGDAAQLLRRLLVELPPKKAATIVADLSGKSKKELYNLAVTMKTS